MTREEQQKTMTPTKEGIGTLWAYYGHGSAQAQEKSCKFQLQERETAFMQIMQMYSRQFSY